MSTCALDTNVVLRLLIKDVPRQHERARGLVEQTADEIVLSDIVFVELVFALDHHYGFTRSQIAEVARGAMAIPRVKCSDRLIEAALGLYLDHAAISFEDCYLVEHARECGADPLWTFDRDLARLSPGAREVPWDSEDHPPPDPG